MPFIRNFASVALAVNRIVLGRSCIVVAMHRAACELPAESVEIDRIFICQSVELVPLPFERVQVGPAIDSVDRVVVPVFVLDIIEKRIASAHW